METLQVKSKDINERTLLLKSEDISKEKLQIQRIAEKINAQSDLKDLYTSILWKTEKKDEGTKIDLSKVSSYLNSLQWKNSEEIQKEWISLSFAVQLFLKSQKLYDGKIDGLYIDKWKTESKTRAAVRTFQKMVGLKSVDGWTGKETIKKMIEILDKDSQNNKKIIEKIPPVTPNTVKKADNPNNIHLTLEEEFMKTPVSNFEISSDYAKLSPQQQKDFLAGKYTIVGERYSYTVVDGLTTRTKNPSLADEYLKRANTKKAHEVKNEKISLSQKDLEHYESIPDYKSKIEKLWNIRNMLPITLGAYSGIIKSIDGQLVIQTWRGSSVSAQIKEIDQEKIVLYGENTENIVYNHQIYVDENKNTKNEK